jgi:hypothetical protein
MMASENFDWNVVCSLMLIVNGFLMIGLCSSATSFQKYLQHLLQKEGISSVVIRIDTTRYTWYTCRNKCCSILFEEQQSIIKIICLLKLGLLY